MQDLYLFNVKTNFSDSCCAWKFSKLLSAQITASKSTSKHHECVLKSCPKCCQTKVIYQSIFLLNFYPLNMEFELAANANSRCG